MKHLAQLCWITSLASLLLAHAALAADVSPPDPPPPPPSERPAEVLLPDPIHFSGLGGPYLAWTRLNGEHSLLVGARGGVLIDHVLVVGIAGSGTVDRVAVPRGATVADADYRLEVGYIGAWLEYIIAPRRLLHGTVGMLIGWAGLSYTRFRGSGGPEDSELEDSAFVIEPTLSAEVNLTSFMRLDLFAAYRFVAGVDLPALEEGDINGPVIGVMLKFGSF